MVNSSIDYFGLLITRTLHPHKHQLRTVGEHIRELEDRRQRLERKLMEQLSPAQRADIDASIRAMDTGDLFLSRCRVNRTRKSSVVPSRLPA